MYTTIMKWMMKTSSDGKLLGKEVVYRRKYGKTSVVKTEERFGIVGGTTVRAELKASMAVGSTLCMRPWPNSRNYMV
jgi:hypothetical protein